MNESELIEYYGKVFKSFVSDRTKKDIDKFTNTIDWYPSDEKWKIYYVSVDVTRDFGKDCFLAGYQYALEHGRDGHESNI